MRQYKKYNLAFGWLTFLISALVFLLTIEPTTSFWDCGEFISASYKLLVGHPPGAPFFLLVGRFFSLFAPDETYVAAMVNAMSALASAFTIALLFWTITHLAKKAFVDNQDNPENWRYWAVLGSGLVGALTYTFSDTFWFSAVEGEVYAMSSLFTALVFWAILKWENVAHQKHSNRWLILIAYLMGLSIGVHLLNLLAIPAIGMVYYFNKFEINRNNTIKALAISAAILLFILYGIIPGVPEIAGAFELAFVNGMGLPFNSGLFIYGILLVGGLIFGIYYSYTHKKVVLNTVFTAIAVIIMGYSSFAMILIRSSAEPTMDQNAPNNVFSLISYLNREQYGDRPLVTGEYYNSEIDRRASQEKQGTPVRIKKNGKYEIVQYRPSYVFDSEMTTFFPRMYSRQPNHIEEYKRWADVEGRAVSTQDAQGNPRTINLPTFGENLKFFFNYQIRHMYWRYFMWNFAGRQNDIQGHGEVHHGNWISGIPDIDNAMYGDQSKLPDHLKNNAARNTYFFLPFILGLLGLMFQFGAGRKGRLGFWVVMLLFFLTGLAIVLYLNQTPLQPRERDYAYVGSFYAFSIWIGLGVLALVDGLRRILGGKSAAVVSTLVALGLVPGIMAAENWDDHDRSHRTIARDLAKSYLNTIDENGIIFTNGDNDTFPLWYVQEVEGIRTDVRVCNLSYLQTDWYIDQMKRKSYESDPLPISFEHDEYVSGTRDMVYIIDRIQGDVDLKEGMKFLRSENERTKRVPGYTGRIEHLPSSTFTYKADSLKLLQKGYVSPQYAHLIDSAMHINFKGRDYILKNEMMVLDMLAQNNWDRPIFYAVTVGGDNYVGLENYFQLEGFGYRIVPIKSGNNDGMTGRVDTDKAYKNFMEVYDLSNFKDPRVYLDENHQRMAINIRNNMGRLATALIDEGKTDSALNVLDKAMDVLPPERVPHNYFSIFLAESYLRAGNTETGGEILEDLADLNFQELDYFLSLRPSRRNSVQNDIRRNMAIYGEITRIAETFEREELLERLENEYDTTLQRMGFFE
jgi:tetratricopeptide (TPR) repeat protein